MCLRISSCRLIAWLNLGLRWRFEGWRLGVGRLSGRGLCRVVAFGVSGLLELAILFITISHCAWQRVISWSLATKKRSKENAFKPRYPKCPQRAVSIHRCPKSTVLARAEDV